MNVLIVDDESLALDILQNYITRMPALRLIGRCNNAIEAFDALNQHKIDLMFLDIQMPQISGIDFLKSLAHPPKVIFTTAFPNYALEGYELNAVDYLLKPISFERFSKAVHKAMDWLALQQKSAQESLQAQIQAEQQKENPPAEVEEDFFFVKADKKLIKVFFQDIYYIEGLKDYVIIHTPTGRIITLQTMKMLETKLPSNLFMRVHRSFIVNLQHIQQVDGNNLIIQKKAIPLGKNYKDDLLEIINKNRL